MGAINQNNGRFIIYFIFCLFFIYLLIYFVCLFIYLVFIFILQTELKQNNIDYNFSKNLENSTH